MRAAICQAAHRRQPGTKHSWEAGDARTHRLDELLTRLRLTAICDQLESLRDEGRHAQMSPREALLFLAERGVA